MKETSAGRGIVYISAAKLYFILVSFLIPVVLPRLLGAIGFGAYSVVVGSISIFNNVIVTATIQAISRGTSADPEGAEAVKSAGVRMHVLIGLPLAVIIAAGSPLIARFYHDPDKAGPIALAAVILALYSFYSVFVGSANGLRAFNKQAALDASFTTLRVSGILGAAALGLGVWGAISAWVGAAAFILVASAIWVGVPRRLGGGAVKPLASLLWQLSLYLLLTNFLLLLDGLLLKRTVAEWYHAHGEVALAAVEADRNVGYYAAAQNLGRLPYQLLLAVTFVIFPLISRSTFTGDIEETRRYVRTTLRYSFIAAGLLSVMLAGNADGNLRFIYPAEYTVAAPALLALAIGSVGLSLFSIAGTMLNAGGHTRDAIGAALFTVLLQVTAIFVAAPRAATPADMLVVVAGSTAGAIVIGTVVSLLLVARRYRAGLPALTVLRVLFAFAAGVAVGLLVKTQGKVIGLAETIACGAAYLAVLVATGEARRSDLAAIRRR